MAGKLKHKGAPDAHVDRSYTDRAPAKLEVNWWWLLAIVVSIGSYIFDIATDIWVAVLLYDKKEYNWAALTVGFTVASSWVMSAFSFRWYLLDAKHPDCIPVPPWKWFVRIVVIVFQLGPILR